MSSSGNQKAERARASRDRLCTSPAPGPRSPATQRSDRASSSPAFRPSDPSASRLAVWTGDGRRAGGPSCLWTRRAPRSSPHAVFGLTCWVLRLFSLIVFVSRREIGSYCHLVSTGRDTFLSMAWASSPVSLLWATFQLTSTSIVLARKAWDGGLGTRSAGTALCLSPKPLSPTCKVRHGKGPWQMPESFCDWC